MTTKVYFMPFDPNHSMIICAQMEYGSIKGGMDKNKQQIDHDIAKGHEAFSVWWNPKKKDPFISSLNTGQVYIRGHGMPGFQSIEGGRGGERVHYDDVVDRLLSAGLHKSFTGDIKCYNCHSAEMGDPTSGDPEVGDGTPFAQRIADELYRRGVRGCRVFGYYGSIDSFAKDGSSGKHKYIRETAFTGGSMQQVERGRVSEGRFQFYGRPTPKKPNLFKRLFR